MIEELRGLISLVQQVVHAALQLPLGRDAIFGAQIQQAIAAQSFARRVGKIIEAAAFRIQRTRQTDSAKVMRHLDAHRFGRAAIQQLAAIRPRSLTRVLQGQRGVDFPIRQARFKLPFQPRQACTVDIDRIKKRIETDQIGHVGLVGVQRPFAQRRVSRHAHFQTARQFGAQGRRTEAGVIQLVEGRYLEGRAIAGGQAGRVGERVTVSQTAGGVPAKLLVVVAPHADFQAVRAETALILPEHGAVAA